MHHNQLQGVEYVEARVTLFPNQYKKVYSSRCIYAKATDNPLKVEKKSIFPSLDQWHSLENIATDFVRFIAGECNGSVNITVYNSMDSTN